VHLAGYRSRQTERRMLQRMDLADWESEHLLRLRWLAGMTMMRMSLIATPKEMMTGASATSALPSPRREAGQSKWLSCYQSGRSESSSSGYSRRLLRAFQFLFGASGLAGLSAESGLKHSETTIFCLTGGSSRFGEISRLNGLRQANFTYTSCRRLVGRCVSVFWRVPTRAGVCKMRQNALFYTQTPGEWGRGAAQSAL